MHDDPPAQRTTPPPHTDATADGRWDAALLYQMIEAAPTAMLLISADGAIRLVNREAERLFGYPREELLGQPVERLVPAPHRDRHPGLRADFATKPAVRQMGDGRDLRGVTRDGREVPVEIGLSPLTTQGDSFTCAAVVDISARIQAKAELARRNADLLASNRDLEQFAYVASHDLQEPLRAVGGCVQLLKTRFEGQIDADADTLIEHAVNGARRMQELIRDLLQYARIGRSEAQYCQFDSTLALQSALRNLATSIAECNACVEHGPLPALTGDPGRFAQLFQNLVGNSIKFRRNGTAPHVRIEASAEPDGWRFSVADNGIGIDAEQAREVFGVFRRLHSQREYPGSGIGLAICQRIVEAHGGRIWVNPDRQEGTELVFVIPHGADRQDA